MDRLTEWKLAEKLNASNRKGIILGLTIAAVVVLVVAAVIIKIRWVKNHCCMGCDHDDFGDDFLDEEDMDENGCCYTSEKDFV